MDSLPSLILCLLFFISFVKASTFSASLSVSSNSTGYSYGSLTLPSTADTFNLLFSNNPYAYINSSWFSCSFSACAQPLIRPLDNQLLWPQSKICNNYFNQSLTGSPSISWPLTEGLTQISFYTLVNPLLSPPVNPPPTPSSFCSVTVNINTDACPSNSYGVGIQGSNNCSTVHYSNEFSQITSMSPVSFSLINPYLFQLQPSSPYTNKLSISILLSTTANPITLYTRTNTLPFITPLSVFDYNITSSSTNNFISMDIINPAYRVDPSLSSSRYFFSLLPNPSVAPSWSSQILQINKTESICTPSFYGSACNINPVLLTNGLSYSISNSDFTYLNQKRWLYTKLFFTGVENGFEFGFSNLNQYSINPSIYIRLGGLPTETVYDAFIPSSASFNQNGYNIIYYQTGPTLIRDAIWYIGFFYPTNNFQSSNVNKDNDNTQPIFSDNIKPIASLVTSQTPNINNNNNDNNQNNGMKTEANGPNDIYSLSSNSGNYIFWLGGSCPNSCTSPLNGKCVNHLCVCNNGFESVDCSIVSESSSSRLSSAAIIILPIFTIFGSIGLMCFLCYFIPRWQPSLESSMPGSGHVIGGSAPGPAGGGGGGASRGINSGRPAAGGAGDGAGYLPPGAGPRGNIHGYHSL